MQHLLFLKTVPSTGSHLKLTQVTALYTANNLQKKKKQLSQIFAAIIYFSIKLVKANTIIRWKNICK